MVKVVRKIGCIQFSHAFFSYFIALILFFLFPNLLVSFFLVVLGQRVGATFTFTVKSLVCTMNVTLTRPGKQRIEESQNFLASRTTSPPTTGVFFYFFRRTF